MNAELRARIDSDLKDKMTEVLAGCGLTWSMAARMFAEQIVKHDGLPFEVSRKPSPRMRLAMKETEELLRNSRAGYTDVDAQVDNLNHGKR
ncbi:type II toxin-antitoxin system RelB/DinJ family antitoxin [Enterobacter kobei]|nr:type II toxin-antitoxin system RelB/DinJ family antitoxin [Enterobacter kobei]